jgi:hypothetical protein
MSEFDVQSLLKTSSVTVRDVCCKGSFPHLSAEEHTTTTQLVFPYRGVYVRHMGDDQAVAEANQVLFFNANEGYRVSHPVPGGDASLTLIVSESELRELAPRALLRDGASSAFRLQRLRIDARAQVLMALLRHSLHQNIAEPLEAESLALTLAQRALGPRTTHAPGASVGRQRLVIARSLCLRAIWGVAGRWPRSPLKCAGPVSPDAGLPGSGRPSVVSLSAAALRLARALDLLGQYDDLTTLSRIRLLQPQSFQRRLPRGIWPLAVGVQADGAASLRRVRDR